MAENKQERMQTEIVAAYQETGTISSTARVTGYTRDTVRRYLGKAGFDPKPMFSGRINERDVTARQLPAEGEVKTYILTSAQNNTYVHERVWDNLLALADHYDAELLIGTFSYQKGVYGAKAVKKGTASAADREKLWFDPKIESYIVDAPVELAPGIIWCGEMNILPTAVHPLEGLEVYTGRKSAIFPHVKVQMQSVASGKNDPTKFCYTTGTVTKRNYIQKKAGLKAEFHHVYGALLVEVDDQGDWWARQLNADNNARICDWDVMVENGHVTTGNEIEAITWGDIHVAYIDNDIADLAWGKEGMLEQLKPRYQIMHDVLDFRCRTGHTAKRHLIHDRFKVYIEGHDSVEEELGDVAQFLTWASRDWCKTVIVDSNHDRFMMEWLRIGDYKNDPVNAIYFLEAQLYVYKSLAKDPKGDIGLMRWAVGRFTGVQKNMIFLNQDESFVINDIEYGMHGDEGPNGSKGTARGQARMGRKMNRGHEHSAGIFEGVYTSGLTGLMDQGYNSGPSSWSHSHIITYKNRKRSVVTMWNGKSHAKR